MEAQMQHSSNYSGTSLTKWFGIGIGIGTVASFVIGNVAVGLLMGLIASFWIAIICRRCLA